MRAGRVRIQTTRERSSEIAARFKTNESRRRGVQDRPPAAGEATRTARKPPPRQQTKLVDRLRARPSEARL